jgi:hypothetical protein
MGYTEEECEHGVHCPFVHANDEWRLNAAIAANAESFARRFGINYKMSVDFRTEYCDYLLRGSVCKHGKQDSALFYVYFFWAI